MSIFENEGNVSQDANYRAHLDNNWNSGNREFDNLWSRINSFDDLFSQFSNLAERMTELEKENQKLNDSVINLRNELTNAEKKHESDVNDLTSKIGKLEDAVYGTNPQKINNDLYFINHPVRIDDQEINNDDEDAVQIHNSTPVIHDNLPKEQVRTQLLNNTDIGGNLKNDTNSK